MYSIISTSNFKKDFKKIKNNISFSINEFNTILNYLINEIDLNKKYRNHNLKGALSNLTELHIKPNILLIYELDKENKIITLVGIGSHSYLRL